MINKKEVFKEQILNNKSDIDFKVYYLIATKRIEDNTDVLTMQSSLYSEINENKYTQSFDFNLNQTAIPILIKKLI